MKFLGQLKEFLLEKSKYSYLFKRSCRYAILQTYFSSVRWSPDLMMILALKKFTNIPIIYDPSHACGNRDFVPGISKAAKALDVMD